jgi:hypothetical protein
MASNTDVNHVSLNPLCNNTPLKERLRQALLNIVTQINQLNFAREDVLDVLEQIREYMASFRWYGDESYSDAWFTKLIEKILLNKDNARHWNQRSFNVGRFKKNSKNKIEFLTFRIAEKIVLASAKSDPTVVANILFERYGHFNSKFTINYIKDHNNPMVFIMNVLNLKRKCIETSFSEINHVRHCVCRNFIISDDMKIGFLFAWINSTKSQTNSLGSLPLELIQKIIAILYPYWKLTLPRNLYNNYIM